MLRINDDWVCIERHPRKETIADAGFMLTAIGIDNVIHGSVDEWQLWVPRQLAPKAMEELANYAEDTRQARVRAVESPEIDKGWVGIACYLLVIWSVPMLQGYGLVSPEITRAGSMQAGALMNGEWWRAFTAMTLHGDFGHILGNSVFGIVIGLMVARNLGSGLGWLLVLISGALGNLANAWLQADSFTSIGASMATFGGLGMVGAFVWQKTGHQAFGLRRSMGPLFAAFAILAFTGVGGENTDVVGHFTGFAAGVVTGLAASGFHPERFSRQTQWRCGTAALALIALAWWFATGR